MRTGADHGAVQVGRSVLVWHRLVRWTPARGISLATWEGFAVSPLTPRPGRRLLSAAATVLLLAGLLPASTMPVLAAGSVPLSTIDLTYTQDFDTLANTGTGNTALPLGWALTEGGGGSNDNEQYAANNGSSLAGDTYSYGATGSSERAFGELRSGNLIPIFGASFTNSTGVPITSIDVAYTGEQWRLGAVVAGRIDRIDFQISTDATSLVTGTWIDVNALDFTAPVQGPVAGALDG